jgi:hypothetical protein
MVDCLPDSDKQCTPEKRVKHLSEDFEKTKREYLDRIDKVIKENNIPDQLVINWDQMVII